MTTEKEKKQVRRRLHCQLGVWPTTKNKKRRRRRGSCPHNEEGEKNQRKRYFFHGKSSSCKHTGRGGDFGCGKRGKRSRKEGSLTYSVYLGPNVLVSSSRVEILVWLLEHEKVKRGRRGRANCTFCRGKWREGGRDGGAPHSHIGLVAAFGKKSNTKGRGWSLSRRPRWKRGRGRKKGEEGRTLSRHTNVGRMLGRPEFLAPTTPYLHKTNYKSLNSTNFTPGLKRGLFRFVKTVSKGALLPPPSPPLFKLGVIYFALSFRKLKTRR